MVKYSNHFDNEIPSHKSANLQNHMFVRIENFGIESKSTKSFEKGDMHVVIIIKSITIKLSIFGFQLE